MGVFDTAYSEGGASTWRDGVQYKVGDTHHKAFTVGDTMKIPDGIYYGNEGAFVVYNKTLVAVFLGQNQDTTEFTFDKWGGSLQVNIG